MSKVEEQGGKPARQGVCKDLVGAPFAGGSSYQREMNFLGSSAPALVSFFFFLNESKGFSHKWHWLTKLGQKWRQWI